MSLYNHNRIVPVAYVPGLKTALETAVAAACTGIVRIGKYKGRTYAEASFDKAYCSWVISLHSYHDRQFHAWLKLRQAAHLLE